MGRSRQHAVFRTDEGMERHCWCSREYPAKERSCRRCSRDTGHHSSSRQALETACWAGLMLWNCEAVELWSYGAQLSLDKLW